jgi:hypothetical protein
MNAPERWVDDPLVDEELREVLQKAPAARPLDAATQVRLRARVARAASVPVAAAGWLIVKSAAATLGVAFGAGALAVAAGVVDLGPRPRAPEVPHAAPARRAAPMTNQPAPLAPPSEPAPDAAKKIDAPGVARSAAPSASLGVGSLSAEAAVLEQARHELSFAPDVALSIAAEHASRFPRGQLAAERVMIQIEALHRLGRDAEAEQLARQVLAGKGADLYRERIERLLGSGAK